MTRAARRTSLILANRVAAYTRALCRCRKCFAARAAARAARKRPRARPSTAAAAAARAKHAAWRIITGGHVEVLRAADRARLRRWKAEDQKMRGRWL